MSSLSPEIIEAYINAEYRVLRDEPFIIRIGHQSEQLASLYSDLEVRSAAFLTAWNPGGALTADSENAAAHKRLLKALESLALTSLPGFGADPLGTWPGEKSTLVLGLSLEQAELLGRQFHQNAIVWIGDDALPRLILLQ